MNGGVFTKEFIQNPGEFITGTFDLDIDDVNLADIMDSWLSLHSTEEWYLAFLSHLPPDVYIDVGNFPCLSCKFYGD